VRGIWAIAAGLALGVGLAWWLRGDQDRRADPDARARAQKARQAQHEDALKPLYRWRDGNGQLQVTDTPPPPGRPYERLALEPEPGIRVDAGR
jgi:hypothetical protein